jgi:hypothetical protein
LLRRRKQSVGCAHALGEEGPTSEKPKGRGVRLNSAERRLDVHCNEEVATNMYKSPELKKLGTFREITKSGISGPQDHIGLMNDGCTFVRGGRCS